MRLRRISGTLIWMMAFGSILTFGQARDSAKPTGITSVVPGSVDLNTGPVEVKLAGWGFRPKAEVRVRPSGQQGAGLDYPATVDSPEQARITIPADMISKAEKTGKLELRVKNPDGGTSEWASIEVRAKSAPVATGAQTPIIDYLAPSEIAVRSSNARVTIHGRNLVDGSTVLLRSGAATSEARANLVDAGLVFTLPAEQVVAPRVVLVQVRTPQGLISETARLTVANAPSTAPGGTSPGGPPPASTDPFIAQVDPTTIDAANKGNIAVEVLGRNIDRDRAIAVIRQEGAGSDGGRVVVTDRQTAGNGTVITLGLMPRNVPNAGMYEVQLINPDGRRSNWARFEITYGNAGGGTAPGAGPSAIVSAQIPPTVTLTIASAVVPIELRVRNPGRTPVRLSQFAATLADGTQIPVPGSVDVPAGGEQSQRVEVPLPIALGIGSKRGVEIEMALTYAVSQADGRTPITQGRYPQTGSTRVTVRNDITPIGIGREYLEADAPGAPSGWRFFKLENEANAGAGKTADFYLFAEPVRVAGKEVTDELWNFRPDESDPARRNLSYLTLRGFEITTRDLRSRELGTRLGYVRTDQAPGLVPLYRWVRTDANRAANHFLTTQRDRSKLPPRLEGGNWTLENNPVGYVIPR